jgi:outer membrane protein insertion porin family
LIWVLWLLLLGGSACNVHKYLDKSKEERLLTKNTIKFQSAKGMSLAERTALQYELGGFYKQQPNRRSWPLKLFQRRVWLYHRYANKPDTSAFGRMMLKKIAEPPAIYDEAKARKTAQNIQNEIRQRGYFNAKCNYETKYKGKYSAKVTYTLDFGEVYVIESANFVSKDPKVETIMRASATESNFKRGEPISQVRFESERVRLTKAMRDNGYAFFAPNYIRFTGDSTGNRVRVTAEALLTPDSAFHKTYRLRNVNVFEGLVPDFSTMRQDRFVGKDSMYFSTDKTAFEIRPDRLYAKIFVKPDSLYRQRDFDQTLRSLNALGVYKFVALRPTLDSVNRDRLDVNLFLTPNKRLSVGRDFDFRGTQNIDGLNAGGNLIGVSFSTFFQHKNLFRGAEHFDTRLVANVEFNGARFGSGGSQENLLFSSDFSVQNQLTLPRYTSYLKLWNLGHRLRFRNHKLVGDGFYSRLKNESQTHLAVNYTYLNVFGFFEYNLFNASLGYDLRIPERNYVFNHIGIDLLQPNIDASRQYSPFFLKGFTNQLFTGFLFRYFSFTRSTQPNRFGERWVLRLNSDLSGLEEHLLHGLWYAGKKDPPPSRIANVDFAKYIRLDMEAIYSREFRKDWVGGLRFATGAARNYGNTEAVPFVKQFFVGGPGGLRAWRIRETGPGAYVQRTRSGLVTPDSLKDRPFFQSGDFRLEFNGELRFPMFWWVKGAVFVDGGNVWNFKRTDDYPGGELQRNSYKNIALGTGFGIRADFDYFVFRLDFGLPLRNPYPKYQDVDGEYWIPNRFSKLQIRDFRPNLAVAYPF